MAGKVYRPSWCALRVASCEVRGARCGEVRVVGFGVRVARCKAYGMANGEVRLTNEGILLIYGIYVNPSGRRTVGMSRIRNMGVVEKWVNRIELWVVL